MPDHAVPLREADLDADPLRQFQRWFAEAATAGVREPEAAAVATATADGVPSVRMVLVKRIDATGFVFFTNYESQKGRELAINPRAALLFHWDALGRQIRIQGQVQRVSAAETEEHVTGRARRSRLSALASPQSHPVPDRGWLERRVAELTERFGDGELPVAENWGGLRVVPSRYEFWQNRDDRLHDRFIYVPDAGQGWQAERLAP